MSNNIKVKTSLTECRKNLRKYVVDCTDLSEYVAEGYNNLYEIITSNKPTSPFNVETVEDWLRGLPSIVNIEFCNDSVVEIMNKCGFSKSSYAKTVDRYWKECATVIYKYAIATRNEVRKIGIITGLQHIGNSYYGNPKYMFCIDDTIVQTATNSLHGYGISNYYKKNAW